MNLTTVAAFTAAALSLVNVAISYSLARRGHREQWRREQERPIVARCLALSDEVRSEWWESSLAQEDRVSGQLPDDSKARQHSQKGRQLMPNLRFEVAQLDLLASSAVRQAADELMSEHRKAGMLSLLKGSGDHQGRDMQHKMLGQLQLKLIDATRADLGLGPSGSLPTPVPGSLLGKLLVRLRSK